jgi:SAM-dependent methyltransferase
MCDLWRSRSRVYHSVAISALHSIEHFGLGRYGDPVDAEAWSDALRSIARVLAPAGRFYLSVPTGHQRVVFNAQRVFDPVTVLRTLSDLSLLSCAAVADTARFAEHVDPRSEEREHYVCTMFEFTKFPGYG